MSHFYDSIDKDSFFHLLKEKMARCDYHVLLIANDNLLKLDNMSANYLQEVLALSKAWQSICEEGHANFTIQSRAWNIINNYGEPFTMDKQSTPYVRRFQQKGQNHQFFFLLSNHKPHGLPVFQLDYMCNLWELEQGSLPVHAAGIVHKGNLFLFSGRSGAGKSTIASICQAIGDRIIDEDQVIVHSSSNTFTADGWGYNLVSSEAPLQAIFHLIQSGDEKLIPLTQSQNARFLVKRVLEVFLNVVSEESMKNIFEQAAEIARCIPGYTLHFRKNPDFWNLIDERFPT